MFRKFYKNCKSQDLIAVVRGVGTPAAEPTEFPEKISCLIQIL
jgi:hypothetical protein